MIFLFFFSSRRRHTRFDCDWSSDVCSSDLLSEENRFLEVTYSNGDKEVLYFKDFASGAMIESVVRRAKKLALKRYIGGGEEGIIGGDLLPAIRGEFKEKPELPNTPDPRDWAQSARQD